MDIYQWVLFFAVPIVVLLIIVLYNIQAKKQMTRFRIKDEFGHVKEKEFTYEEFQNISHYFRNFTKDEYTVDDITWNDLDMDEVFMLINHTRSSIGQEVLYKMLRTPVYDEKVLLERDRVADKFAQDENSRIAVETLYNDLGYAGKYALSDYIDQLFNCRPESNAFNYMMWVMLLGSIAYCIFVEPVLGVLFLLVSAGISIISYYKLKSRVEAYFDCIKQIVMMANCADKLTKLKIQWLDEYNKKLEGHVRKFTKVTRNSYFLSMGKNMSGSLVDIIMDYVRLFTHIDLIKFNNMMRHLEKNKEDLEGLEETLGNIEALISVANFRKLMFMTSKPELIHSDKPVIFAKELYHPLIKEPVANSIDEGRSVLITGSNASGKSTFLKSMAINAILSQTIYTALCKEYKACYYRIFSSMALADDLDNSESYYIVEIKSLKRIIDASNAGGAPVLCFIDEVLRGTNTVERIAASSQILKNLADNKVMCFAATHDIELTHILDKVYSNYHFTEEVIDNNVVFNYKLNKGRSTSRNAIRLLAILGYDDKIIKDSENMANEFIKTGVWRDII